MNIFDYVVIGIVAASLLLGLWRGVVGEAIALAAWVLAFFAAMHFGSDIAQSVFLGIEDKGLRAMAGFAAVFIGVLVVMALVRLAASSLIKALGLGLSDRLLGLVFGVARGAMIAVALVAVGGMTSAPRQDWWQEATLSAPLETAVLAVRPWLPPDFAKRIRFK
ncbi:MAG: Colicin production protein [Rhodocyclaceae bacterium]|nr:Colicin production protein [Rhodocyclaceae bacterium]